MAGNVSRCGHVLNNPLVLYFTVFVSRIVTKLLSLYHRSHCATRCADCWAGPCACSQGHDYPTSFSCARFPKPLDAPWDFCLAIRLAGFMKPHSESVRRLWNSRARRTLREVINSCHVLSNISSFEAYSQYFIVRASWQRWNWYSFGWTFKGDIWWGRRNGAHILWHAHPHNLNAFTLFARFNCSLETNTRPLI